MAARCGQDTGPSSCRGCTSERGNRQIDMGQGQPTIRGDRERGLLTGQKGHGLRCIGKGTRCPGSCQTLCRTHLRLQCRRTALPRLDHGVPTIGIHGMLETRGQMRLHGIAPQPCTHRVRHAVDYVAIKQDPRRGGPGRCIVRHHIPAPVALQRRRKQATQRPRQRRPEMAVAVGQDRVGRAPVMHEQAMARWGRRCMTHVHPPAQVHHLTHITDQGRYRQHAGQRAPTGGQVRAAEQTLQRASRPPRERVPVARPLRQRGQRRTQSARPRSSSLTLVLLRVLASTCLTITAQYSECDPSLDGNWPDTTTLYGGTEP